MGDGGQCRVWKVAIEATFVSAVAGHALGVFEGCINGTTLSGFGSQ